MSARTLKIEAIGDFCYGKVTPRIRLGGQWLERAGFKPGSRVQVQLNGHGELTLRLLPSQASPEIARHPECSIESSIRVPQGSPCFTVFQINA